MEKIIKLTTDHKLTLPKTEGKSLIWQAKKTFKYIDPNFVNWGINNPGIATAETLADVYAISDNRAFISLFQSLPGNLNQKWISQNQLIDFCEIWTTWLTMSSYGAIFLIKIDEHKPIEEDKLNNMATAYVQSTREGLHVLVRRPEHGRIWGTERQRLVVCPKLPK